LDLKISYPLHALPDDYKLLSFARDISTELEGKDDSVSTSLVTCQQLFDAVRSESAALWKQLKAERTSMALKYKAVF
jgi:hypothetical protein